MADPGPIRDPRCPLPFEIWPADDRRAWQEAITPGVLFSGGGTAAHWAAATRRNYLGSYGRFLAFLEDRGWLDPDAPFCSRARPDWIAAYVEILQARISPLSVWSYMGNLHNIFYRLAPACDWSWLRKIVNRLHLIVGPRRNITKRLRPIDEIYLAGVAEMDRAEALGQQHCLRDSVLYRDGLMVALLAATLVRLKNFAALEFGRHLIRQSGAFFLAIASSEVKNKRDMEQPITDRLTPYLDRYFDHHHPRLLNGSATRELWINRNGGVIRPHSVGQRISKVTKRVLGVPISPHLFRHCAATSVALDDPEHAMIIKSLLGHSRIFTAEKYYNRASIAAAGRRHAATISQLRDTLKAADLDIDQEPVPCARSSMPAIRARTRAKRPSKINSTSAVASSKSKAGRIGTPTWTGD